MASPNEFRLRFTIDTNVVSYIVKKSRTESIDYEFYASLLCELKKESEGLISSVVKQELFDFSWTTAEEAELIKLLDEFGDMPPLRAGPPSKATVANVRDRLQLGQRVDENDVAIIAQAAQHECGFVSHDKRAIRVATGMGIQVFTQHQDMELIFAGDELRLRGWSG